MVKLMIAAWVKAKADTLMFWKGTVVPIVLRLTPPGRRPQNRNDNFSTPTRTSHRLQNFPPSDHNPLFAPVSQSHQRLSSNPLSPPRMPYHQDPLPTTSRTCAKTFLKKYSTMFSELLSMAVFILALLPVIAGHSSGFMQDSSILSINTTDLQLAYHKRTGGGLAIHDVYSMFMTTYCDGYWDGKGRDMYNSVAGVHCSKSSSFCKFPNLSFHT
jgi:hypothetical protein